MAGEYLSPQEAQEVELSLWPPKRRKQLREYAGQLAVGVPQYEQSGIANEVVSRDLLVILAQGRETVDHATAIAEEMQKTIQAFITGVPDSDTQPTLFDI